MHVVSCRPSRTTPHVQEQRHVRACTTSRQASRCCYSSRHRDDAAKAPVSLYYNRNQTLGNSARRTFTTSRATWLGVASFAPLPVKERDGHNALAWAKELIPSVPFYVRSPMLFLRKVNAN